MEQVGINGSNEVFVTLPAGPATRDVSGLTAVTLNASEASAEIIELTGVLTGNIVVTVPLPPATNIVSNSGVPFSVVPSWMKIFRNSTSGAFTMTVQGPGGSGTVVPQGDAEWLYSKDGTNVQAGSAPAGSVMGPPLTGAFFDASGNLTGVPTFITVAPSTNSIFIGATASDHGSSSQLQLSSLTANGCQFRSNQYGANAGAPGISTFKSRGTPIGTLGGILAGDILFRATSVGVAPDNLSIPLASFITVQVPAGFVPAGQNFVPSEYELQLVPLAGPINSRRVVFKVSSEGETQTLSGVRAGGPNTLPANLTTGTLWSSGIAQPNGAIIGSPGDLYSSTGGGAGTTLWVKESGVATNTGWVGK